MLGRNSYTQAEVDTAATAIDEQLAAYRTLVEAIAGSNPDAKVTSALEEFEPRFFDSMTLALDRSFVHRVRAVSGKDGNPLNEVELIADSLLLHDGVLTGNKVIVLKPGTSASGLDVGDRIRLGAAQFERLSKAFLAEIRARFL